MSTALIQQLRDALQSAMDGLAWYRDRYPEAVDGSDDEAEAEHAAAITAADTAMAQPVPVQAVAPEGWVLVPKEPTPEMVAAYLAANHTYWKEMDEGPAPIGKYRNGTPAEATAESYSAMLAAAPAAPTTDAAKEQQA